MSIDARHHIECFSERSSMIRVVAKHVVERARHAVEHRGRFLLTLSGGSTPEPLYELLATPAFAARIEWPRVHLFWGDERCVPPDHPDSNYRMAREALIDHVPLPPANVHRIHGEDAPAEAAVAYEDLLRGFFGNGEIPPNTSFDLVLLGMGPDGHTGSLFAGSAATRETHRWVVASPGPQPESWRVTLTPVLLNAADDVTFIVTGAEKAEHLKDVLENRLAEPLPAQLIRPKHGALHWMIDAAAASRLQGGYAKPAGRADNERSS